jgi:hypothetical protein
MKKENSANTGNETVLTRCRAAEYLHVCTATLDKLPIPKIQAGRRVLYRQSAIENWLALQERASVRRA